MTPKSATGSRTQMTEFVLPTHANALGGVFGGQILAWMDLCAAICAQRFTGSLCVTAGMDELSFELPIQVGQVVRLDARVTAAFRTSLEIFVDVRGEESTSGRTWPCVSGYVTFVAIKDGAPAAVVPALLVETDDDLAHHGAATERRRARLARRAAAAPAAVKRESQ